MGINILFAQDIESNIKERLTDYFNKYTATAKISRIELRFARSSSGLIGTAISMFSISHSAHAPRYIQIRQSFNHFAPSSSISEADVEIVRNLLREVKPHQIFVAGDLADPHGTHRVCTDAVFAAVCD